MLPEQLVKQISLAGNGPFHVLTMRLTKNMDFVDLAPSILMYVDPQSYDDTIYTKSHEFIEKLMIKYNEYAANEYVANKCTSEKQEQTVFRTQSASEIDDDWPEEYRFLLANSARYSLESIGHHSMGLEKYTHATSPMRRYADVIVQRLLKGIKIDNLDEIVDQINEKCAEVKKFYRDLETIRLWRILNATATEDLEAIPLNINDGRLVFYIPKYKRLHYLKCCVTETSDHKAFIVDQLILPKFKKQIVTMRSHAIYPRLMMFLVVPL
jgi:exoribonuclease R